MNVVEKVARFRADLAKLQIAVDTLAAIGDSCEAPVAIQAREALRRLAEFPASLLDAVSEPSEAMIDAGNAGWQSEREFGLIGTTRKCTKATYRAMIAALRLEVENG